MLVARAQGGAEPLTSVRRTGRGWRSQCRSQGHGSPGWATWGERGVQGHEQGEPGRETSPAGPSEGPVEGHAPGVGAAFSLGLWSQGSFRAGECSLRCTVRSGAVQSKGESWAARVATGRTRRRQRLSRSGPCPALSGGRVAMQTSRTGFWGCLRATAT